MTDNTSICSSSSEVLPSHMACTTHTTVLTFVSLAFNQIPVYTCCACLLHRFCWHSLHIYPRTHSQTELTWVAGYILW